MLPRLLLNTKNCQKWAKTALKLFFCPKARRAKGQSPPQELKVGPRSGPYLLVNINTYVLNMTEFVLNVAGCFVLKMIEFFLNITGLELSLGGLARNIVYLASSVL